MRSFGPVLRLVALSGIGFALALGLTFASPAEAGWKWKKMKWVPKHGQEYRSPYAHGGPGWSGGPRYGYDRRYGPRYGYGPRPYDRSYGYGYGYGGGYGRPYGPGWSRWD